MGKKLIIKGADFSANAIIQTEPGVLEGFTYFGSLEPNTNRKPQINYQDNAYKLLNLSTNANAGNWRIKYINMIDYVGETVRIIQQTKVLTVAVMHSMIDALKNDAAGYAAFDAITANNPMTLGADRFNFYDQLSSNDATGYIDVTISNTFNGVVQNGAWLFISYVEGYEPEVVLL